MAKYDPLQRHLQESALSSLRMTNAEVADLVGGLPISATNRRTWWANEFDGKHVQAHSWIEAGYKVVAVSLGHWVEFEKTTR